MKLQEYSLKDPVYRTAVRVIVTPDPKEIDKILDEWGYTGEHGDTSATQGRLYRIEPGDCTTDLGANMTLIWLRNKSIPCMVHELSHHVTLTFHEKFIPMNWDNTEVYAYYLEYMVQQLLDAWTPPKLSQQDTRSPQIPSKGYQKNAKGWNKSIEKREQSW